MNDPASELIESLPSEIHHKLDQLVSVAEILGVRDLDFTSYASAISRLDSRRLSDERALIKLKEVEDSLRRCLAELQVEDQIITGWIDKFSKDDDEQEETVSSLERQRQAALRMSVQYKKELDAILAEIPQDVPVTFQDHLRQKEENAALAKELTMNRAKLKAFQGLSPNKALARKQLESEQEELNKLIQLRERLLGGMARSVR
jgi:HAUS augmin-like complex subunit 1